MNWPFTQDELVRLRMAQHGKYYKALQDSLRAHIKLEQQRLNATYHGEMERVHIEVERQRKTKVKELKRVPGDNKETHARLVHMSIFIDYLGQLFSVCFSYENFSF